ncbi:MAG: SDR family NAD(P)-dependent oxidoreductase, partial [Clostridia bacterium]|nr:SDR family NAD(P)-dependent oxidoreductase [Clostridia bacterium]
MAYNFKGDVVVITGAASGIGKGTALQFAKAGADLALCDFNAEQGEAVAKECRDLGVNAKFYQMDITDTARVNAVRDEVLKDFGKVTCLF